jgi:SAM-dependent methyltransferase
MGQAQAQTWRSSALAYFDCPKIEKLEALGELVSRGRMKPVNDIAIEMKDREAFYENVVRLRIPDKEASILICGGGKLDRKTFVNLGYRNVTISNLDTRIEEQDYSPFKWRFENVEALSCEDASYDYVVIHAAIHHTSSPHRAVLEMYRVARKGMLAFEARDSALMHCLERFQVTPKYEHAAVYFNDCKYGGVNNTDIPNFVFRWTEREVEKTIQSYAPYSQHTFEYAYGTAFPCTPALEAKGALKAAFLRVMRPFYWLFTKIFVKQQNLFAFYVAKPAIRDTLFPWLVFDQQEQRIKFNKQWGDVKYKNGRVVESD